MHKTIVLLLTGMLAAGSCVGQTRPTTSPVTRPADGKLPHVEVDVKKKQVRVECESVAAENPLEFFLCATNTQEHEAVLRSAAKASHIHLGLLMLGLEPGAPVHYSKAQDKWFPPHGPPLHMTCEFQLNGKQLSIPASRMMRNTRTKKEAPAFTWVFTGSRHLDDGAYAADVTGYLVSVVNFDLTLIDIPLLASSSTEALEWEINPDAVPPRGTKVWLVIEPAGQRVGDGPATKPAGAEALPADDQRLSGVTADEAKVKDLREMWEKAVAPHRKELATAATTHYRVMAALRREQQRLIDESDRIQRVIEELERQYQDMTTPRPEAADR